MPFRQGNSLGASATSTTIQVALSSAVLAGSRLMAYIVWGATSGTVTVSDTLNLTNGWVKVTNSNASESTGPTQGEWWTNPNSVGGAAPTITVTYSVTQGFRALTVHEVTGTDKVTGAAAQASARSQVSQTNFTTLALTPTQAGSYVAGGTSNDIDSVVPTANSPFLLEFTTANQVTATEDEVQGAAASVNATFQYSVAKTGIANMVIIPPAPAQDAMLLASMPRQLAFNPLMRGKATYLSLSTVNQIIPPPPGGILVRRTLHQNGSHAGGRTLWNWGR